MDKGKKTVIITTVICGVLILLCIGILVVSSIVNGKKDNNNKENEKTTEETLEYSTDLTDDYVLVTDDEGETITVTNTESDITENVSKVVNQNKSQKSITLKSGLTSNNILEVLAYYKLACAKNSSLKMKKKLALISMDSGKVTLDDKEYDSSNAEAFFLPVAKALISFESKTVTLPGAPEKIKESDWLSATAVNDGKYTTLRIKVKEQTDGIYGNEFDGPVGRSMTAVGGFSAVVDEINGVGIIKVTPDYSKSDLKLHYSDPTIVVKVENATGKFVKGECRWHYVTHTIINVLDSNLKVTRLHTLRLENSGGYTDYEVSY